MFPTFVPIPALRRLAAAFVCLSLTSLALAGNVHTVGGAGGAYADIQSAVDAAAAGDTILIRSGSYVGFVIDNRSLAVVADTGATVDVTSAVSIRNLEAGRTIMLAGLRIDSMPGNSSASLHLLGNEGSVRVQSCVILRSGGEAGEAVVDASEDVAFVGCTLRGALGYYPAFGGGDGGIALRVVSAVKVALYDCNVFGGQGEDGREPFEWGGRGGSGCYLDNGAFLFASGTTFRGGNGGAGADNSDCFDGNPVGDGGNGGDGIQGGGVHIVIQDSPTHPGIGGRGGFGCGFPPVDGSPGADGHSINIGGSSTLEEPPVSARRLVMPTPVRETSPIHITLTGQPGELAYLTMWGNTGFLYSPGYSGVILEKAPLLRRIRLGVVPASGVLDKDIQLPDLGPGVQSRSYYFQAYFLDSSAVVTLGSPAFVVTLDSSF